MSAIMAEKIKELLVTQKMTQKELAAAANITEAAVSHYLKGEREPRGAILLNIAKALHTNVDYLVSGKQESDDGRKEIDQSFRLLARNGKILTEEDRMKFLSILLKQVPYDNKDENN